MKPYGIKLADRRPMYDYRSDKFNSRGCINICQCSICKRNGKKHKIRRNTARAKTSTTSSKNRMRTIKKRARQLSKILIINQQ